MTPQVGFEPTTRRLTVVGSAAELLRNIFPEGKAGDGDRTRDKSLEGSHVTATPHPQIGSYMREEVVVVSLNAQRLR